MKTAQVIAKGVAAAALLSFSLLGLEAKADSYQVQSGDSFYGIASLYGIDPYELAAANGMGIFDLIVPGQELTIPLATVQTEAPLASPSYYLEGYDYEAGITYPIGQCTWAAKKLSGWAVDWWGNAATWADYAAAQGYAVGYTPAVGSLIVWNDGAYGHVAYVTDVAADGSIQVLEANYNGNQYIANYRGWFNPLNSGTPGAVSYIYAPY